MRRARWRALNSTKFLVEFLKAGGRTRLARVPQEAGSPAPARLIFLKDCPRWFRIHITEGKTAAHPTGRTSPDWAAFETRDVFRVGMPQGARGGSGARKPRVGGTEREDRSFLGRRRAPAQAGALRMSTERGSPEPQRMSQPAAAQESRAPAAVPHGPITHHHVIGGVGSQIGPRPPEGGTTKGDRRVRSAGFGRSGRHVAGVCSVGPTAA